MEHTKDVMWVEMLVSHMVAESEGLRVVVLGASKVGLKEGSLDK